MRHSLRAPFPVAARLRRPIGLLAVAAAAALSCLPAHAGLLEDDEARKAILDLRQKVKDNDAATQKREADMQQLIQQLQSTLLDLNNQNEAQRADIAKLRGQNEELARAVADVQRSMKDMQQSVGDRLRKFEPQSVTQDGKTFSAQPEEKTAFDAAMATLRNGDFDGAANQLDDFLKRWPASGYDDSARFWLGNAQYGKRDYKGAVTTFRSFLSNAPDHPRAPEALLAVANCQIELKEVKAARRTLAEIGKKYPQSEAAGAARDRLAALK